MPSTTNFNWTTPADTDLVKDGASAIRTLANGIDTSFVDLKGGTTGQVLSKASNTDLDFTWSSVDPLTILDAKGDLISATAADTPARLAVGTNGQFLSADSTTSTGLKWVAAPSGNLTLSQIATGSMSGSSVNFSSLDSYDEIIIFIDSVTWATGNSGLRVRLNGSSSSIYNYAGGGYNGSLVRTNSFGADAFLTPNNQIYNNSSNVYVYRFTNCKASGFTNLQYDMAYTNVSSAGEMASGQGWFASSAAVSSIAITTVAGHSFNGGTYYVIAG